MSTNKTLLKKLNEDLIKLDTDDSQFINTLQNMFVDKSPNSTEHTEIHANSKPEEILDRLLIPKTHRDGHLKHDHNGNLRYKTVDGTFVSNRKQWEHIALLLENESWKESEPSIYDVFDTIDEYKNLPIDSDDLADDDDSIIGTGFININGFFHKFDTPNCATVIIKKDSAMPYGFKIQTAFPGLIFDKTATINDYAKQQAEKLNVYEDDCSDVMKQTNTYINASDNKKEYLLFHANPKNADLKYDKKYDEKTDTIIIVPTGTEDCVDITKSTKSYQNATPLKKIFLEEKAKSENKNKNLYYDATKDVLMFETETKQSKVDGKKYKFFINKNELNLRYIDDRKNSFEFSMAKYIADKFPPAEQKNKLRLQNEDIRNEIESKYEPFANSKMYTYALDLYTRAQTQPQQQAARELPVLDDNENNTDYENIKYA